MGWPPIRASRKNLMAPQPPKSADADAEGNAGSGSGCLYVKVSMDGAPYLRKVDLKIYGSYTELSSALEKMFSCFTIGKILCEAANYSNLSSEISLVILIARLFRPMRVERSFEPPGRVEQEQVDGSASWL